MPEAKPSGKIGGEDRISALSDDLIIQILSLVPTKDAVSTTFLSKRWRFVWTKLPILDYKETETSDDVKSKKSSVWWFLDESMRFHNAPLLELLCIELGPQCPVDVDVVKWVAKAVDHCGLRNLLFDLQWKSKPIIMPNSLYTCKTLTTLILCEKILVDVPSPVCLPSLIVLDLIDVVYKDEDSLIRLLSSCPVLKHLRVSRRVDFDDNVRRFIVKVPSLLILEYWDFRYDDVVDIDDGDDDGEDDDDDDADDGISLVIDTPALIDIFIVDGFGHSCSMEYMPHLRRAEIDILFDPDDNFLRSLSSIKFLKLYPVDIMVPWCNVVYSQLIKCRIFLVDLNSCESLFVLLSICPILKVFTVEIDSTIENNVPVLLEQPSSVPKCLSSHLEIFGWNGYAGSEDEKEVIRYILENSKCLKKARITLNSKCNLEERKKMVKELKSMPRVSTCVLSFLRKKEHFSP